MTSTLRCNFTEARSGDIPAILRLIFLWPLYLLVQLEKWRQASLRRRARTWTPPPDWICRSVARLLVTVFPVSLVDKCHIHKIKSGAENHTRILYVANHQLLALEIPSLLAVIYLSTGHLPRGIMDRMHLKIPLWADLVTAFGGVNGDPNTVSEAMSHSHPLLVFPGGHHEVYRKKSDPKYTLCWRQRAGFARLAVQYRYTIVPVSAIGTEDMLSIIADFPIPDCFMSIVRDSRREITLPICLPVAYQRMYIRLGKTIPTDAAGGRWEDAEIVWDIREETRRAIQEGFQILLKKRATDRKKRRALHGAPGRIRRLLVGEHLLS